MVSIPPKCAGLVAAMLLGGAAAHADFRAILSHYKAGDYEAAHAGFLSLAELGDCASQFNLGSMALQGQGGPQDRGTGVGWVEAAEQNGCQSLVDGRLPALKAQLTEPERRSAASIIERYGREALRRQQVVDLNFAPCAELTPPHVVEAAAGAYPSGSHRELLGGLVITEFTIGVDGFARDPRVLLSQPTPQFAAAAIEAWLNSRFTAATYRGAPMELRVQLQNTTASPSKGTAGGTPLQGVREAAEAGDSVAAYTLALAAPFDASLSLYAAKSNQLLVGTARDGNPQAQYLVWSRLQAVAACRAGAAGAAWLSHAADGGEAAAQLALASELAAPGASAAQLAQARALLELAASSDDYYVRKHVAALLAASPFAELRDPATARTLATGLAAGAIQADPQMFEVIAAARAAAGDFRGALTQQRLALSKAYALGWSTQAMEEHLAAYRSGVPWRGDLFGYPAALHAQVTRQ